MTREEVMDALDMAERAAHELRNEFLDQRPEECWDDSMIQEMNDAESEVDYLQERLDTGDYED